MLNTLRISTMVALLCVGQLQAQTVIVDDNLTLEPVVPGPSSPGTHRATVCQDEIERVSNCDYTSTWFAWDGENINVESFNIDEGSDWYVVQPGDVLGSASIGAGQFPVLVNMLDLETEPEIPPPVKVGAGNAGSPTEFYLGVTTGQIGIVDRNVFGWIHLRDPLSTGQLEVIGSAVAYGSKGIVVGTTTVVPEPASLVLVVMGLVSLLWCWPLNHSHLGRGEV